MAQTKRKRKTKHRGNAAGVVEAHGNTGKGSRSKAAPQTAAERRAARMDRPPTWTAAINRAAITAVLFALVLALGLGHDVRSVIGLTGFMFILYIPLGYWTDSFMYKRRMAKKAQSGRR